MSYYKTLQLEEAEIVFLINVLREYEVNELVAWKAKLAKNLIKLLEEAEKE